MCPKAYTIHGADYGIADRGGTGEHTCDLRASGGGAAAVGMIYGMTASSRGGDDRGGRTTTGCSEEPNRQER